jgi:hypothetical protein
MFLPTLWAYRTCVNTSMGFTPFQLVHRVEAILLIGCEIPSLNLGIELLPYTTIIEQHLVHLEQFNEQCRDALPHVNLLSPLSYLIDLFLFV